MYGIESQDNTVIYSDLIEKVQIVTPKEDFIGLIQVKEPMELKCPQEYEAAVKNPIGSMPLSELGRNAKKVTIIVSDATRAVPTSKILPYVLAELTAAGIKQEQVTIVIAIGVHRPATPEEIIEIMGKGYADKLKIINHDPYNKDELVYIGDTSYGTPVEVNKTVYNSDLRVTIGKVEPHEFAGFSGGRKSVLPGIASEKTIKVNHRPGMLLNENAGPGIVDDNPISNDMLESAKMLGIHFSVNFVLNSAGNAVGIFCGDLMQAHYKAIEFMRSFCQATLHDKPDIIVTTPGYPLNIDFYQSIKPLIALTPVISEGMVIVLYSSCPDGFNSDDMLAPYEGTMNLDNVITNLVKNYKIQMDHALLLCKILQKKVKIVACSPNV
ncbi:MAG: nickel-dependent lactate racemase, partial [Clostridia bacterium]